MFQEYNNNKKYIREQILPELLDSLELNWATCDWLFVLGKPDAFFWGVLSDSLLFWLSELKTGRPDDEGIFEAFFIEGIPELGIPVVRCCCCGSISLLFGSLTLRLLNGLVSL